MTSSEYSVFNEKALDYLDEIIKQGIVKFSLNIFQKFSIDESKSELYFLNDSFPTIKSKIQIVGSISLKSNTWFWAWANPSFGPHLWYQISKVIEFGELNSIPELINAKWSGSEDDGWRMTAIAAYLLQAKGVYRVPIADNLLFVLLTEIESTQQIH